MTKKALLLAITGMFLIFASAGASETIPTSLSSMLDAVKTREKEMGLISSEGAKLKEGKDASFFETTGELSIRTMFDPTSTTIHKKMMMKRGMFSAAFLATLENDGEAFTQKSYATSSGDIFTYHREGETFLYSQTKGADASISVKEWACVEKPPKDGTLRYAWKFESPDKLHTVSLKANPDGSVSLYREMVIAGIDANDAEKKEHVMGAVRQALRGASVKNEEIARFSPPVYWTGQGVKKQVSWTTMDDSLILDIQEEASAYPLLIDPTVAWGQWLGGTGVEDQVNSIAINGDEIYAGGSADTGTSFEGTFQGTFAGAAEGFVVEITDGTTPAVAWGQWLGGTGTDAVQGVAVNGDEIYAGGFSANATSWEGTFQGTHSGSDEGFVVEIADGATPSVAWGQWLGGTGSDIVRNVAVTGDEIYAGGHSASATSWEGTFQGTFSSSTEGFVVEIADGTTPSVAWGQWLGGSGADEVHGLAVTGDEIYVAGFSSSSSSWEGTFQGSFSGSQEGFVVEVADGTTPSVAWGQWLGGTGSTTIYDVAVSGDEIYTGGYSNNATSWEGTFQGAFVGGVEGFVVEIADGSTPSVAWGQWLGGSDGSSVGAVTVTGEEIYAVGVAYGTTNWEGPTFTGTFAGSQEVFVTEIADGGTPAINWIQWIGGTSNEDSFSVAVNSDEIYIGGVAYGSSTWEATFQGTFGNSTEGFVVEIGDDVPVSINISGTCQAFDQTTNCGDLGEIRVAVNGALQAQADSNGGSGGTWSLSSVSVYAGDVITVFINNAADADEAVAVAKVPATPIAITGMKLFKGHLSIGSSDNQTITNTNLEMYDNEASADEDIFYESDTVAFNCDNTCCSAGLCTDALNQFAPDRLYIVAGNTLAPGGAVTTTLIDIRGTYNGAASDLTLDGSGTNTTCGNSAQMPLCVNGGTFTTPSTVYFTGTSSSAIYAGSYQNLYLWGGVTYTINSGTLAASNEIQIGGGGTAATVDMDTNDPVVDVNSAWIRTGSTLIASNSAAFTVSGNWTNDSNFTDSGGTVTFDATATGKTLNGQMTGAADNFNNVTFNGVGGGWTQAADMEVVGNLNITNGTFNQGASFNLTTGLVTVAGGAIWNDIGTGDITLTGNVTNSGTITLQGTTAACGEADAIVITGGGVARNWSGGTWNLNDLTVSDTGTTAQDALSSTTGTNNVWLIESDCIVGGTCA